MTWLSSMLSCLSKTQYIFLKPWGFSHLIDSILNWHFLCSIDDIHWTIYYLFFPTDALRNCLASWWRHLCHHWPLRLFYLLGAAAWLASNFFASFVPRRIKSREILEFVYKAIIDVISSELLIIEVLIYVALDLIQLQRVLLLRGFRLGRKGLLELNL